jgi:chaperonin GroES
MANQTTDAPKLRPLADRVIVRRFAEDQRTPGGLHIPEANRERPTRALVVAVGPGKDDKAPAVSVGDTILFGKYSGSEVEIDGEKLLIMREDDLLAVVVVD